MRTDRECFWIFPSILRPGGASATDLRNPFGEELLAKWGNLRGPDQQFPSTLLATVARDGRDPAFGTPRKPQQLAH